MRYDKVKVLLWEGHEKVQVATNAAPWESGSHEKYPGWASPSGHVWTPSGHASGHVFREGRRFEKELCASLDDPTGAAAAWWCGPIQMFKEGQE